LTYDDRHRRVLEQLLLHGPLSFEDLQRLAKLRRSDDAFGLIMGTLAEKAGKRAASKPVEWWWSEGTRFYRIKASVLASMVKAS
jgi:hypothetical protein